MNTWLLQLYFSCTIQVIWCETHLEYETISWSRLYHFTLLPRPPGTMFVKGDVKYTSDIRWASPPREGLPYLPKIIHTSPGISTEVPTYLKLTTSTQTSIQWIIVIWCYQNNQKKKEELNPGQRLKQIIFSPVFRPYCKEKYNIFHCMLIQPVFMFS